METPPSMEVFMGSGTSSIEMAPFPWLCPPEGTFVEPEMKSQQFLVSTWRYRSSNLVGYIYIYIICNIYIYICMDI